MRADLALSLSRPEISNIIRRRRLMAASGVVASLTCPARVANCSPWSGCVSPLSVSSMITRDCWTSVIRNRLVASGVMRVESAGSSSQRSRSVPHVAPNGGGIPERYPPTTENVRLFSGFLRAPSGVSEWAIVSLSASGDKVKIRERFADCSPRLLGNPIVVSRVS